MVIVARMMGRGGSWEEENCGDLATLAVLWRWQLGGCNYSHIRVILTTTNFAGGMFAALRARSGD